MAQAAAAQDLSQEHLQAPETGVETGSSPEKAELGKALEGGADNVISLFKGKAEKEKEALQRLGQLEETDKQFSPEISAKIQAANDTSYAKVDELTNKTVELVKVLSGEEIPAVTPAPVEFTPAEVAKFDEAAKQYEAPAPVAEEAPETEPEHNEMAERQKREAQESMQEDLDALNAFASEHNLHLDADMNVSENELKNLTRTERTYVAVLQAKYRAGHASEAHADALMAVAAERDPEKKKALSKQAFDLSETAKVMETAATLMNEQYMALPEIAAIAAGNETGGSVGGNAFHEEMPPAAGAPPEGPQGPNGGGPEGPNLRILQGGAGTRAGADAPLYNDKVYGKPAGVVQIETMKRDKAEPPEKPRGIHGWVMGNLNALQGFWGGGDSKDRH
jgi:hypothetical protein